MDNNQFAAFSFSGSKRKAWSRAKVSKDEDSRLVLVSGAHNAGTSTGVRSSKDELREDERKDATRDTLHSAASATLGVRDGENFCKDDPGIQTPGTDVFPVKIEGTDENQSRTGERARFFFPEMAPAQTEKSEEHQMSTEDANAFNADKPISSALKLESTESAVTLNGSSGRERPQRIPARDCQNSSPLPYPALSATTNRSSSRSVTQSQFSDDIEDYSERDLSCPVAVADKLDEKKGNTRKRVSTDKMRASSKFSSPTVDWKRVLREVRIMRTGQDAPVDLHGPQQLVDENADPQTQKFQILVAAMISSQTRDSVTASAMKRLHAAPGGLTVDHIARSDVSVESLEDLLKPVHYNRQKAKHLKGIAEILSSPPYCGCVPSSLDELMKLPGVGPKVGLVVLWVGFGMGEVGLIVDTNVRRVSCRLGWAPEGSSADQVRIALEKWLPKDTWAEISFLFAGFGQQVCKPIGPKCNDCGLKNFCPSAFKCAKAVNKRLKPDSKLDDDSFA